MIEFLTLWFDLMAVFLFLVRRIMTARESGKQDRMRHAVA